MDTPDNPSAQGYEAFYRQFDSPVMRQIRRDAYGQDIGQHSWVSAEDLRRDILRLKLSPSSRFLDLGCGPCGPLTFVLATIECQGTSVELSRSALQVGRARAVSLGIEDLISLHEADLNEPLSFATGSFDAIMALDVVLHLRDRSQLFQQVVGLLSQGGRFLFTDAGIVTGSVSSEEIRDRSIHGYTEFTSPGINENLIKAAGFRLLEVEDRTESMLKNASGRLAARQAHRAELEQASGVADFERQQAYLETVIDLSRKGAVSRMMYLAEVQ